MGVSRYVYRLIVTVLEDASTKLLDVHFQDTVNFKAHDQTCHTHFWLCPPKTFWSAFNFCESVSTYKKSVIPSVHSSDTVSFRVPSPDWPHPFLTMPTCKIFNHISVCMNLAWITSTQKISYFQQFIFETQLILESKEHIGHIHFWPYPTKTFSIRF